MSEPPDPGSSQTAAPSSIFKSMLDAALVEYKKKTGDDLLAHWLALEVQSCQSVDAVLDVLREQAKAFDRSGDQKVMKWIDPLVHVLYTFSGVLGDSVGHVFIAITFHAKYVLTFTFEGIPPREVNLYWDWYPPWCPCSRSSSSRTASI